MQSVERFCLFFTTSCLAVTLLVACTRQVSEYRQTLFVFGTLVEVTIVGAQPDQAIAAVQAVDAMFQHMHVEWHAWKPGGELAELNRRLARGETVTVSESLAALISQSKELSMGSEGLFNPAIGGLISLWGFQADELPSGPPPPINEIAALVEAAPGMNDLAIDGRRISSRNPALKLDMGGFAKGYALNEAIDLMRERGIADAIVNAGGDLCVSGDHAGRPWRIGIRHPQGGGVLASVQVADGECVLTSGNYERYREYGGRRYAHVIDPRSGWPVDHVASATVIHRDGGVADAAATALTVAGPATWRDIARRMGLVDVMLVDEDGVVYLSASMADRIQFEDPQPGRIVTDE
jgi:thiamine biosynthesis lipoprotein